MSFLRPTLNTKRAVVADGVFRAELNEFFSRSLAEYSYSGLSVTNSGKKVKIVINVAKFRELVGEEGRKINELRALVCLRFGLNENQVQLFANRIKFRGLSAQAQVETLRLKLADGVAVRRAAYSILRLVMEAGAIGCEVIVAGKARGQRAKGMKFREGYLLSSGTPSKTYVSVGFRNLLMRQGMIGMKVKIMAPYDPKGEFGGCTFPLPDHVIVSEPKN